MRVDSRNLSGPVRLVAMALEGARAEHPLVALPPEPGLPELFAESFPWGHFLYHDYAVYRRDKEWAHGRAGTARLSFAPHCDHPAELHDLAVVFLPKGKELIEFTFSWVAQALGPRARTLIAGPNKSAIRSSRPLMEKYLGRIGISRSARHSVIFEARESGAARPFEGQKEYLISAYAKQLRVITLPGVFSYGRLDEGTKFLLDNLSAPPPGKVLDLGCGSGVIGAALKFMRPEMEVNFVDSNVMALEATRRTLAANGLDTSSVWPSDGFSDVRDKYDMIVSNPPFHTGLRTNFSVTKQLIREAGRHLRDNGRIVIVTNAFINYLTQLRACFEKVRVVAEDRRYRLIEARGPRLSEGECV